MCTSMLLAGSRLAYQLEVMKILSMYTRATGGSVQRSKNAAAMMVACCAGCSRFVSGWVCRSVEARGGGGCSGSLDPVLK